MTAVSRVVRSDKPEEMVIILKYQGNSGLRGRGLQI